MDYCVVERKKEQCGSDRDQQGPRMGGGEWQTKFCPKQSLEGTKIAEWFHLPESQNLFRGCKTISLHRWLHRMGNKAHENRIIILLFSSPSHPLTETGCFQWSDRALLSGSWEVAGLLRGEMGILSTEKEYFASTWSIFCGHTKEI